VLAGIFVVACAWHRFILPLPEEDRQRTGITPRIILRDFVKAFVDFFRKKGILPALLFMLTYRLGESQLVKLASPFLLDEKEQGGLALSTAEVGVTYGTVGVLALMLGGILGGIAIAKSGGLRTWLWPMALSLFIPNLAYLYMAYALPDNLLVINACVGFEQFGYGFGFTAYTMYLMLFSEGEYKTSHYAICTGFMALGMMLPGMASGWIQEQIGYQSFFIWVLLSGVPVFLTIPFLKIKEKPIRK
jgi:PAT family beta-lactamase induction signal transducer AmpG